jgi:hypothetical protein
MKNSIAIAALLFCTGCSTVRGTKLLVPTWFDMEPIADRVFVNKEMPSTERAQALMLVSASEKRIVQYYGKAISTPKFFFCSTDECFKSFGGSTSRAKSFGDYATLFSPRGMSIPIISHERSHAELYSRIDSMRRIPQWFDEGLAVTVSDAPEHSENHWQFLVTSNIPRPARDELYTYKSLKQWIDAVHRYGDDSNIERRAKGEPEIYPVYSAAGHELRFWFSKTGTPGLLAFIERMNNGENFESAYQVVNTVSTNKLGTHQ